MERGMLSPPREQTRRLAAQGRPAPGQHRIEARPRYEDFRLALRQIADGSQTARRRANVLGCGLFLGEVRYHVRPAVSNS
jgi:hypothetical protein